MADFGEIIPEANVFFQKYQSVRLPFRKFTVILKVNNLQIEDQVEQDAR